MRSQFYLDNEDETELLQMTKKIIKEFQESEQGGKKCLMDNLDFSGGTVECYDHQVNPW